MVQLEEIRYLSSFVNSQNPEIDCSQKPDHKLSFQLISGDVEPFPTSVHLRNQAPFLPSFVAASIESVAQVLKARISCEYPVKFQVEKNGGEQFRRPFLGEICFRRAEVDDQLADVRVFSAEFVKQKPVHRRAAPVLVYSQLLLYRNSHIADRENFRVQHRNGSQYVLYTVRLFGYTGFLVHRRLKILVPPNQQSGITAIDCICENQSVN